MELAHTDGEVRVYVGRDYGEPLQCPECGQTVPGYDTRKRKWRHLDTCQLRTILIADVPMINCSEHGVRQIDVPWAEENSRFTALFDSLVIDWLHEASIKAVAQRLRISWGAVDGIMQRAVARGLIRRDPISTGILAVDEKAYKKRHKYLTVVSDGSRVLHVADKRREDSLAEYFRTLESDQKQRIRWVSMDMWAPYIRATTEHLPHGANKIAFDRFHVAKQFNDAVDFVRRKEHKALIREGDSSLKGTKYYLAPQRRPR